MARDAEATPCTASYSGVAARKIHPRKEPVMGVILVLILLSILMALIIGVFGKHRA